MSEGQIVLKVEQLSKKFCSSTRRSMYYGLTDIMRNILGLSRRSDQLRKGEFRALHNVSFQLHAGEALGLVGQNGSGKSTLLSLINGIYQPDEGMIEVRGRVGALIQLGAGFHPLLTGRENIYVNAAILGLTAREVDDRLDQIIEFAGVGDFIDSPVRTYSSGMYARLGFSVAVHASPDILLVDEVLAVGDAQFRARAIQRMWEMRERGTAVVFVSHNIQSVLGFCDRILLLERGRPVTGTTEEMVSRYQKDQVALRYQHLDPSLKPLLLKHMEVERTLSSHQVQVTSFTVTDDKGQSCETFGPGDAMKACVRLQIDEPVSPAVFTFVLRDPSGLTIWAERSQNNGLKPGVIDGSLLIELTIDPIQLRSGRYVLAFSCHDPSIEAFYAIHPGVPIEIRDGNANPEGVDGFFLPHVRWSCVKE